MCTLYGTNAHLPANQKRVFTQTMVYDAIADDVIDESAAPAKGARCSTLPG